MTKPPMTHQLGEWHCRGLKITGHGITMLRAYRDWVQKCSRCYLFFRLAYGGRIATATNIRRRSR